MTITTSASDDQNRWPNDSIANMWHLYGTGTAQATRRSHSCFCARCAHAIVPADVFRKCRKSSFFFCRYIYAGTRKGLTKLAKSPMAYRYKTENILTEFEQIFGQFLVNICFLDPNVLTPCQGMRHGDVLTFRCTRAGGASQRSSCTFLGQNVSDLSSYSVRMVPLRVYLL